MYPNPKRDLIKNMQNPLALRRVLKSTRPKLRTPNDFFPLQLFFMVMRIARLTVQEENSHIKLVEKSARY